mmetsp:Transcript_11509/g.22611  ORF Transcript_11509/g.22611 Transcript_11509/m.22611 type:complete len:661 (+) Transcript_11509:116-2098(+)
MRVALSHILGMGTRHPVLIKKANFGPWLQLRHRTRSSRFLFSTQSATKATISEVLSKTDLSSSENISAFMPKRDELLMSIGQEEKQALHAFVAAAYIKAGDIKRFESYVADNDIELGHFECIPWPERLELIVALKNIRGESFKGYDSKIYRPNNTKASLEEIGSCYENLMQLYDNHWDGEHPAVICLGVLIPRLKESPVPEKANGMIASMLNDLVDCSVPISIDVMAVLRELRETTHMEDKSMLDNLIALGWRCIRGVETPEEFLKTLSLFSSLGIEFRKMPFDVVYDNRSLVTPAVYSQLLEISCDLNRETRWKFSRMSLNLFRYPREGYTKFAKAYFQKALGKKVPESFDVASLEGFLLMRTLTVTEPSHALKWFQSLAEDAHAIDIKFVKAIARKYNLDEQRLIQSFKRCIEQSAVQRHKTPVSQDGQSPAKSREREGDAAKPHKRQINRTEAKASSAKSGGRQVDTLKSHKGEVKATSAKSWERQVDTSKSHKDQVNPTEPKARTVSELAVEKTSEAERSDLDLRLEYLQALQQQNALLKAQLDALTSPPIVSSQVNTQLRHDLSGQGVPARNSHLPNGLDEHGMDVNARAAASQAPVKQQGGAESANLATAKIANGLPTLPKGKVSAAKLAKGLPPKEELDEIISTFVATWQKSG